jgi:hypothetical protein
VFYVFLSQFGCDRKTLTMSCVIDLLGGLVLIYFSKVSSVGSGKVGGGQKEAIWTLLVASLTGKRQESRGLILSSVPSSNQVFIVIRQKNNTSQIEEVLLQHPHMDNIYCNIRLAHKVKRE